MEDKFFEQLDELNIYETDLLFKENINLSLDDITRKRIEKSIKKKTGYYNKSNTLKDKISDIIRGMHMKKKIALAASAALVLTIGGGGYAYARTPVAYVSLDINPSVELGVNAFDKVVSAEAYNEDGEKVIEGTNLINTSVDEAVSTVISNAISDGYIKEDGTSAIEITTATDKEDVAAELEESVKEVADKTLENNNVEAEVETAKVSIARRDEARQLGITPGKLNLIQKLQKLDPSIKVEDYKASSVKEIMKKTIELRKNDINDETTIDSGTNTEVNTDIKAVSDVNNTINGTGATNETDNGVTIEEKDINEGTLSSTPVESRESKRAEVEKSDNDSKDKNTDNNLKKEEKSNNSKSEKSVGASDKKESKSQASQGNSSSSKADNSNNSKSERSNNSGTENSKGKGKNN